MDWNNVLYAFLLTLFAGLSTGIGSVLAIFTKRSNTTFLSVSLGFSAGVMIYVSMIEIMSKARDSLSAALGVRPGAYMTVIAFFVGIALIMLIDKFVPDDENPHEAHTVEEMDGKSEEHKKKLMRMGTFTALAIAIHNFPEGIATFMAALSDPNLGVAIAVAIAIHNIPEGIAVAVPVYYATGSKAKAFKLSFLSGLSEPVGAVIGYLVLYRFLNDAVFGFIFAAVAGIMVYISVDELLPASREYGKHHYSIYGMIGGMAVMAVSLLFFI